MGYCKEFNFFLFHIPKNAGTSMLKTFDLQYYLGHISPANNLNFVNQIKIIEHKLSIPTIAVVRNPWDRFVSIYLYSRLDKSYWHDQNNKNPLYDIAVSTTFEEFVAYFYARMNNIIESFKQNKQSDIKKYIHIFPQYLWITIDGTIVVDHVIQFAELEASLERLGITKKLAHVNKCNSMTSEDVPPNYYRTFYNEDTKRMIAEMYTKDIELFGYVF